jgi:polyvinyl alcohol dehydrogenase (cytochrome)
VTFKFALSHVVCRAVAALGVVALAGSGGVAQAQSPDVAASQPAPPDPAQALFMERCSGCHDQPASRAPATAYLATRLPTEIVYTLTRGEMRKQAEGLSIDQIRSLAAFLTHRPMDVEPALDANSCAAPGKIAADPKEWAAWGHDVHNTRFQTDPGFTAADLPRLKVKWAFALPGLTGSPIAAGGHLFVSSRMGKVVSLDAKTGCTYWAYDAGTPVRNAIAVGAVTGGKHGAFFGDQNAIVHALDAETGKEMWQKRVDDYAGARIVGSITYYDGRLYVPVTSGDEVDADDPAYECCKFRGSVVALDAATGKTIWKAYTIQQPPMPTRVNSAGTQMYGPSGAGVWAAPTVDAKRGIIFVGTGDSYTAEPTDASDAVIAYDIKTGKRLWTSQVRKGDAWIYQCDGQPVGNCPTPQGPDYDFSSPPLLQTMANGKDILVDGSKSATVYGFDPDAKGKILWSSTVGGGSSLIQIWGSAADPDRVYVATPGPGLKPDTAGGMSGIALKDGKTEWRTETPTPVCAWGKGGCFHAQPGAVTLIPGAVFSGALDGHLRAYDAKSGAILWDMDTAQTYDAVNGVKAYGGNLDGAAQTVADGTLFVNSGNAMLGSPRHGDAVLAITVDGK